MMTDRSPEEALVAAGALEETFATARMPASAPDALWPTPIDFLGDADLTGAPELRRHHLPNAVAPFVFDTAERMGVDPATVGLPTLVSIAAVINDRWKLQPKRHDHEWTECARLWGAIVGPPSILKSPVIRAATRPLDRLEADARRHHAEEMQAWKAHTERLKAEKAPKPWPSQPRCNRFLVEGTTVEALSEVMRDDSDARYLLPCGKVLIRQDELAEWVSSLDQYKSGGRGGGDRGAYLRLYNGGRYTVDRIGRGSFAISNWSACLIGGIQPEPIQRIARDAADDGLLQRFLFVVPAMQGEGQDRRPDGAAIDRYEQLFPVLRMLHPPQSTGGAQRVVVFHDKAHAHREALASVVKAVSSMPDASTRLQAALGKWTGTFARIALIFHLVEIADAQAHGQKPPPMNVVTEETAARAAALMREVLLPHMLRADALLYQTAQTGHARWIAGYILASEEARRTERIAVRDIQRAYKPLRAPEDRRALLDVLGSLELMGWLQAVLPDNPSRPTTQWQINPALYTMFATRAEEERRRRDAARAATAEAIRANRPL